MGKPNLRVATAADASPPAPVKPKTLKEAIETGTYLEICVAQRAEMVASLPDAKGPALPALHRQINLASKEIEALKAAAKQEAKEDGDADAPDEPFDSSAV